LNELLLLLLTLSVAGAAAGITAGLFGNGGGFVVVPALIFVFSLLGDQNPDLIFVAIGTSLATIVVSSARAVRAHQRRGAVDFDVLRNWAFWLVLGVFIGLIIASMTDGDRLYVVFAIGVFVYATYFLFPDRFSNQKSPAPKMPSGLPRASLASFLGGFSALLGIGGGTVTVITMVTCQRPIYQAVATASGVGFIIGLSGAIGFALMGLGKPSLPYGSIGYVNFPALMTVGATSILTAPLGAKWAHSLEERSLKRLFGIYLILVSIAMFWKSTQV
tara:strand:+ start:255 stop:1079 length:825 start_codon:yes stop_codon:yes gene_type:complete